MSDLSSVMFPCLSVVFRDFSWLNRPPATSVDVFLRQDLVIQKKGCIFAASKEQS